MSSSLLGEGLVRMKIWGWLGGAAAWAGSGLKIKDSPGWPLPPDVHVAGQALGVH
jgi:hypothetical protein